MFFLVFFFCTVVSIKTVNDLLASRAGLLAIAQLMDSLNLYYEGRQEIQLTHSAPGKSDREGVSLYNQPSDSSGTHWPPIMTNEDDNQFHYYSFLPIK